MRPAGRRTGSAVSNGRRGSEGRPSGGFAPLFGGYAGAPGIGAPRLGLGWTAGMLAQAAVSNIDEGKKGSPMWPRKREDGKEESSFACEHLRFSPEREELNELLNGLGLEPLIRHRLESGDALPLYEMALAQQLRLTDLQSPRLYGLFKEVCSSLQFRESADLYVVENPTINAAALHSPRADLPHAITLTSHMVEMLTDEELLHVLGHELGHLAFGHYRMRFIKLEEPSDEQQEEGQDSLIARRLRKWNRMAELSADRVGFVSAASNLRVVVSANLKIVSGLGPEHLRFDLDEYLRQLDDLPRLGRREVLHRFSHPVMALRIWALQQFARAGGVNASRASLAEIDSQTRERLKVMNFEPATHLAANAREVLVTSALLAFGANGRQMTEGQQRALGRMLLPLCDDPDEALGEIHDADEAWKRLRAAAGWMKENGGEACFACLKQLLYLMALGGRDQVAERLVFEVAQLMGIPKTAVREVQIEVCAACLRVDAGTRSLATAPAFGLTMR